MQLEPQGAASPYRDHSALLIAVGGAICGAYAAYAPQHLIWAVGAVGTAPLLAVLLTGRGDPLRPFIIVPFTYALYAIGPQVHQLAYGTESLEMYARLHAVGLLGLMFGIRIGEGPVGGAVDGTEFSPRDGRTLQLAVWCLLALATVSISTQLAAFGGLGAFVRVGYGAGRVSIQRSTSSFGAGFEWWLLACVLLWFLGRWHRQRLREALAILLALPILVILLQVGGRGTIVYAALFAAVLFHYGVRRLPARSAILALVVGLSLAQLYNAARFYLPEGLWTAARESYRIVLTAPQVLLPTAANEFSAPSAALLDLLEHQPWERAHGSTYLHGATAMVPGLTDLLGLGGSNPSLDRLRDFYPEFYAEGRGLGYSPAAEGWLNFGAAGVLLHLGLYGWAFGRIYRQFLRRRSLPWLLLLAGAMPMFALDGLRIHSGAFFYKGLRVYAFAFVLFVLIRGLSTRGPTARTGQA